MPNIQKNQHVVPVNGNWGVKGEGNSRYTKIFEKQIVPMNMRVILPEIKKLKFCYIIAKDK